MLAVDESMGSLEELSENLHQHLDTHIDHTSLLHYELDMLRSQINEKNRLVSFFVFILIENFFCESEFIVFIDINSTNYY